MLFKGFFDSAKLGSTSIFEMLLRASFVALPDPISLFKRLMPKLLSGETFTFNYSCEVLRDFAAFSFGFSAFWLFVF